MKAKKPKFDVLSPDGFSIHFSDTYNSEEEAKIALKNWCKRYELQGYYSSVNGRISLKDLKSCCKIINLTEMFTK